MGIIRAGVGRHRGCFVLVAFIALAFSTYIKQVTSLPVDATNQWPTFPRRNIAALARDGYLKSGAGGFKRSISTLAKNGQLPTYRSPYDETDRQEQDDEEAHEKRNIASIARMRSYAAMKRNIQALARDGYRVGRGQYNQQNEKRNIAALARNGLLIHKKDETNGDEYYYPFYQNPIPPLSEIDGPFDFNQLYDLQQSINPDMFPPLSQVYKRDVYGGQAQNDLDQTLMSMDDDNNWYYKRGSMGLPVHGLFRPIFTDPTSRTKRYVMNLPDEIDHNDVQPHPPDHDSGNDDKRSVDDEEMRDNFEKRHIGSLARKHSADENFGIREYNNGAEVEAVDPDDADVPGPPVPAYSHPTGRILHGSLNDLPHPTKPLLPPPILSNVDFFSKNRWHSKEHPRFYHFRSFKIPSDKRYLLLPTVDNFLLRKAYRNSSLPGRRKNQ